MADHMPMPMPTWEQVSWVINQHLFEQGEWAGIPMPVAGFQLTLESKHPWADRMQDLQMIVNAERSPGERLHQCRETDIDELASVVNQWYSHSQRCQIVIYRQQRRRVWTHWWDPRTVSYGAIRQRHDTAEKAKMALDLIGISAVWNMNAEAIAMNRLEKLIKPHLFDAYCLTGSFLETSPRSQLTYMFRRCRPTLVMSPRNTDPTDNQMRLMSALCLHPIGYYQGSWGGSMVPTDEVIAHLLLMRGDEHLYWRRANQHDIQYTEAGL